MTDNTKKIVAERLARLFLLVIFPLGMSYFVGFPGWAWFFFSLILWGLLCCLRSADGESGGLLVTELCSGTIICRKSDGSVIRVIGETESYWNGQLRRLKHEWWIRCFSPSRSVISISAHPITDNPKVKDINYSVSVKPRKDAANIEKFRAAGYWDYNSETLERFVRLHLFDFNEQESRRLAGFSNPLRQEQQDEFSKLVGEKLTPVLEPIGVEFLGASFNLN